MATQTRTPQPAPVLATREKPPSQTLPPPQQTHDRSSPTAPVAIDELPPDLLAELPKISITAHSYSKKAKTSFIFANDRMLRENETLSPELQLENITPDGMIFNYKGYRFRRGLQP
jgi:general secretion pathway protein B